MVSGDDRDPLERLSEAFLLRQRRGEKIDLESFSLEHPDYADQIRALFPTLLQLEGARDVEPARTEERIGRWRILNELGRGGMGVVYLAEDVQTKEQVALKLMTANQAGAAARFRREAEALARIEHPGICRVMDVGSEGDRLWIAFEYLRGETVADVLRRARRSQEDTLSGAVLQDHDPARWLAVGEEVARALHATHEAGLVHRDIKPANIMLTADGRVVVLDFGLAQDDPDGERTRLTNTGVPIGTPAYMSPEQVHARPSPLDGRTDVYALGASLYEATTLRPPFEGPSVASLFSQILTTDPRPARRLNPTLTRDQELVLATALEKRPERRYKTALDFANDLRRSIEGRQVRARAPGPLRRLVAWAVRNPVPAAITTSVLLALATGLVVALALLANVQEANEQEAATARRARSRALAYASAEMQPSDASLSLLLARAAVRAQRSPETISQLHSAVHGSLERARLTGHGGDVTSLGWNAAATMLATGCSDGWGRLFQADGSLVCTAAPDGAGEQGGEIQVAISPSGSLWATRQTDRSARLWSSAGTLVARLDKTSGHTDEVRFLDDDTVATVDVDGHVALYDAEGSLRRAWRIALDEKTTDGVVLSIAVSRTSPVLHVLTQEAVVISYDRSGQELQRLVQARGSPDARLFGEGRLAYIPALVGPAAAKTRSPKFVVLSHDAKHRDTLPRALKLGATLCGADTWWCVWSSGDGATVVDRSTGHPRTHDLDLPRTDRPHMLCASADGGRICTVRSHRNDELRGTLTSPPIRLWTPRAAPLAALSSTEDTLSTAELASNGQRLALAWHAGGLVTIHATAPEELATGVPRWRGRGYGDAPMVTADGRHLVYQHNERQFRVLRDDGTEMARIRLDASLRHQDFEPRRGLLLSTGTNGAAWVHDLSGTLQLQLPSKPPIENAVWLGREGAFVTQLADSKVRFHRADGTVATTVDGQILSPPPYQAFEDEIAIATPDTVRVCGANGKVVREFTPRGGERPNAYHGSSSGRSVISFHAGRVRTVYRCLNARGAEQWNVSVVPFGADALRMSRDGARIALPTASGLELRDGAGSILTSLALPGALASLAFDRATGQLVATSYAGAARVWDREGRRRFDLPSLEGRSMAGFSADGRRLAIVTAAMVRLYTTDVDELMELAARRSTRELTDVERAQYADMLGPKR